MSSQFVTVVSTKGQVVLPKALRDRHGEYGIRRETVEPGQARYLLGPPPELSEEGHRLVAAWGGWVDFCRAETLAQGQLLAVAQAVIDNAAPTIVPRPARRAEKSA